MVPTPTPTPMATPLVDFAAAVGEGLVELDDALVPIVDGGARRVPPVGVDERVAERRGQ